MLRSNSANTDSIPNMARPLDVRGVEPLLMQEQLHPPLPQVL